MKNLDRILFGLFFIVVFVFGIKLIHEPDLWWMLRTGEWITQNGVPSSDPFSFTFFGTEWVNIKWLFEVLVYSISSVFGVAWITFLQATFNVLIFWFLWKIAKLVKVNFAVFAIVSLASLFALEFRMLNRPEMSSHLLSVIFIFLWLRSRQTKDKIIWAIIPLQALWANLHEAYAIGVVISTTFILGAFVESNAKQIAEKFKDIKTIFFVGFASGLAVVLHPYHVKMLLQPFEIFSQLGANKFTTELYSISTQYYWENPQIFVVLSLVSLLIFSLLFSKNNLKILKEKFGIGYFILLVLFGYLSTTAHRNIPFFVLILIPFIGFALTQLFEKLKITSKVLTPIALTGSFIVYGLIASNWYYRKIDSPNDFGIGISHWNNPIQVSEFMRHNEIKGKGFSDYLISSYLLWDQKEDFKSYIDFRDLDIFPEKFFNQFLRITEFPVLFIEEDKKQDFDYVTLYRLRFSKLHKYLYHSPDWELAYADIIGCVYVKKSKFPNIQKGSFSVQQSQLQQTRYQATLSNLFWPFSKTSFEPYSDDIEGANFYKNISDYGEAQQFANKAKEDDTWQEEASVIEANIYLNMADEATTAEEQVRILDKSIAFYQPILQQNPENTRALFGLGFALYKKGDFTNSQSVLLKLIKVDPNYFDAYQVLANLQNMFMNTDSRNASGYADKWFDYMLKAYAINPEDEVTKYKLGVSYCQRNQCNEAKKYLEGMQKLPQLTDVENQNLMQCKKQCKVD